MKDSEWKKMFDQYFSEEEIENNLESLYSTESVSDDPSFHDFDFDEFGYWGSTESNFVFPANKLKIFDQSENRKTMTACSIYAPRLGNNGQNIIEYEKLGLPEYEQLDPKLDRLEYRKYGNLYTGGTIQNALKFMIKAEAITWWAVCSSAESIDTALLQWKVVVTGSKFGDRGKVFRTRKYSQSNRLQWHIFCIVWKYRDNYVGMHGYKTCPYFLIEKKRLPKLFSKNAMLDRSDIDQVAWFKARHSAMQIAPLNSKFYNETDNFKIKSLLAEVTKEMRSYYKFNKN